VLFGLILVTVFRAVTEKHTKFLPYVEFVPHLQWSNTHEKLTSFGLLFNELST